MVEATPGAAWLIIGADTTRGTRVKSADSDKRAPATGRSGAQCLIAAARRYLARTFVRARYTGLDCLY